MNLWKREPLPIPWEKLNETLKRVQEANHYIRLVESQSCSSRTQKDRNLYVKQYIGLNVNNEPGGMAGTVVRDYDKDQRSNVHESMSYNSGGFVNNNVMYVMLGAESWPPMHKVIDTNRGIYTHLEL